VPSMVAIRMTSGGSIWIAAPADATYLYLEASAAGVTGSAIAWTG
jgi:hypothetical protein